MMDLRFTHVFSAHQERQQSHDPQPRHRRRNQQFELAIVVAGHGGDMEHASDPRAVADVGQRQRAVPFEAVALDPDLRCRDVVQHRPENGEQVNEVADRQVIRPRDLRDLRVETDAGAVREVPIVHAAEIDISMAGAVDDTLCEKPGRRFPVERD